MFTVNKFEWQDMFVNVNPPTDTLLIRVFENVILQHNLSYHKSGAIVKQLEHIQIQNYRILNVASALKLRDFQCKYEKPPT